MVYHKFVMYPFNLYGASRMDAGVHANFQVCTFQTSGTIPVENIPRAKDSSYS